MSDRIPTLLPHDGGETIIRHAVEQAYEISGGWGAGYDQNGFTEAFAAEIAEFVPVYGLANTWRMLVRFHHAVNIPPLARFLMWSNGWLGADINRAVERAVLAAHPGVKNYIDGRTDAVIMRRPVSVPLTPGIYARVPSWEADAVIERSIETIETSRRAAMRDKPWTEKQVKRVLTKIATDI